MPNVPINKALYQRVKREAKRKFKVFPSAYASGWIVKTYKQKGGKYKVVSDKRRSRKSKRRSRKGKRRSRKSKTRKSSRTGISRWFKEKWIDACQLPKRVSCGRKKSQKKNYPYCRPSVRVSPQTPKTIREIGRKELKKRCSRKRKNPYSRLKNK